MGVKSSISLSFKDVETVYCKVISGEMSFENADMWANEIMLAEDEQRLTFVPPSEENKIWKATSFLHGIDMLDPISDEYMASIDMVKEALVKFSAL